MNCKYCNAKIDKKDKVCSNCGLPLKSKKKLRDSFWLGFFAPSIITYALSSTDDRPIEDANQFALGCLTSFSLVVVIIIIILVLK